MLLYSGLFCRETLLRETESASHQATYIEQFQYREHKRGSALWSAWWVMHLSLLRMSLYPVSSHNCWFFRQHHFLGRRMAVGDCRNTPLDTRSGISSHQENTSLCSHPFLTGKPVPEIFKPFLGLPHYYSFATPWTSLPVSLSFIDEHINVRFFASSLAWCQD